MELQNQVILLLLGQILTIIAVFFTNYLTRKNNNRLLENELQIRKRIEHLQEQLTIFYGPIYELLRINRKVLRVRYDTDSNQQTDKVPTELWNDLRDNVMIPNNQAIVEIIKNNFHLIEGDDIPPCIMEFVIHAEVFARRRKYRMQFDEYINQFHFPAEFSDYIFDETSRLKKEYNTLVSRNNKKVSTIQL